MSGFASKLRSWLVARSPKKAAVPVVEPRRADETGNSPQPPWAQRIETNVNLESCIGLLSKLGAEDSLFRGPDGDLVAVSEHVSILLGCGHVVTQLQAVDEKSRHIRGIAGFCADCLAEYCSLLEEHKISAADAERLSLTCSDCGRITVSGSLRCPKHYSEMIAPDGTSIYIDAEHAKEMKRRNTVGRTLAFIDSLFGEDRQEIPDNENKEQKNAPNPISIHFGNVIQHHRPPDSENNQESAAE